MDPVRLSIFANRIEAVCDEMGAALRRAAFSPNIRDRLDYSCAVFDAVGELCAQAAHIPVHLGSMAFAMRAIIEGVDWQDGDMVIINDPYMGGTHLPDVTVIAPVFIDGECYGFVANRAHHADIGAEQPGSMPLSTRLEDEGLVIKPQKLVVDHAIDEGRMARMMASMRNPAESRGDFSAQIAANRRGHRRLTELIRQTGTQEYRLAVEALNHYAEQLALSSFQVIPDGEYHFEDVLDDDGLGNTDISIRVCIAVEQGLVTVDFDGSSRQVEGNVNCPISVTAAAVYYVFRCLLPPQTPACAGSFRPLSIKADNGSLLNARYPAAVAAGNVETSTRVVDVVLGALSQAIPEKIPAASHGSMNNVAMGASAADAGQSWDYYETIGGGMGAGARANGIDAVQTHMTNTLNTPIEAVEMAFPLRVNRYQVRHDSGGSGEHTGGAGIVREFEFLQAARITLLTERRTHAPWGLHGAECGMTGRNLLNRRVIKAKVSLALSPGDVLTIETAGGGGWGKAVERGE
ncbi:MAG: hydantoinase B/oxoprolinase family protein [Gammaproteobacteria bacterium]|nr:hydantoinase B/oxoprolinase family protein [Gammaproteobacteria bacterium]